MTASFTCPRCSRTSYNPNDVREGYCGNCHGYTADSAANDREVCECGQEVLPLGAAAVWEDGYHSPYECGEEIPPERPIVEFPL